METFGEDPILNSQLAARYVRAVQSKQVIATVKHYAAYNQETNRGTGLNVLVDQQTLREVYTLMYDAVDHWADPGAAMCSFNKINGVYSCENPTTLRELLKGQLRFRGFMLTDFGAIHDTLGALFGGTDMETGTTTVYDGALLAAIQSGQAPMSLVNDACLRILRSMFRLGIFDHGPYDASSIPVAAHAAVAQKVEENAITLLKNSRGVLPLSSRDKKIALIGADANITAAPDGAPFVLPATQTTLLDGITSRAHTAGATVNWVKGNDPVNAASMLETRGETTVPSSVLSPTNGSGTGLTTYYWHNPSFQGSPAVTRTEQQVNYDSSFLSTFGIWGPGTTQVPLPPTLSPTEQQSVVYDGHITAPRTGNYALTLTGWGDATLSIDADQLISAVGSARGCAGPAAGAACRFTVSTPVLHWTGGQVHTLHITYAANRPLNSLEPATLLLEWTTPAATYSPAIQQAAATAARSDVAIVYVRTYEGEQRDRVSLHLPQSADQLIAAVRAANPRTIVVLANDGPVTMPWRRSVPAVVETYFGGEEQGAALARVLWGDVNPSGKLTLTYPTSDTSIPRGVTNPWATGGNVNVTYGEGIDVGYKGYDRDGIAPLFPFGYGLSYTRFAYSGLGLAPRVASPTTPIHVRFRITNTGARSGAEVGEVYVGLPASTNEPPKRLVAFRKVNIGRGSTASLDLVINPNAPTHPLGYFNVADNRWEVAPGTYRVYVGASERGTPLAGTFVVR